MQRTQSPLSLMTTMQPAREHLVTSLPAVPPALNDGTGSGLGRFAGNPVPSVNVASACGFGVTLPLLTYSGLTKSEKSFLPGAVTRNLQEFLVTGDGEVVGRFASAVVPASPELRQANKAVIA